MNQTLILASSSPRRRQLLQEAGIIVEVHPAHIPEVRSPGEPPVEYVRRLAQEKAETVARNFPDRHILAADTTVVVDHQVLEKPVDLADARRMLRLLSGREHSVITAVSLVRPGAGSATRIATTKVFFRDVSDREINAYIAGGEPMDKAGAYAIQGGAGPWVERIDGEYSNVVGLPLSLVTDLLREAGLL
ncbi:MAG TPA: Maf family protein [Candidatus Angelobacter sp.]|nr:Maf family protein [Candidatus Angelobacter sp.]